MFERYSAVARSAVFVARMEAGDAGATSIDTEHLLIGILTVHPELAEQLSFKIDAPSIRSQGKQSQGSGSAIPYTTDLPIAPDLVRVLEHAISIADAQKCHEIRTEHLVASMLEESEHAAGIVKDSQVENKRMSDLISTIDCSSPQQPTEASHRAMLLIMEKFCPTE